MTDEKIDRPAYGPKDPGRVLNVATKDSNGRRLVLREHEFGMTRSLLEYNQDSGRFHTIAHAVRMFK